MSDWMDSDDWEQLAMECFEAAGGDNKSMFLVTLALRFRMFSIQTEKREREREAYHAEMRQYRGDWKPKETPDGSKEPF